MTPVECMKTQHSVELHVGNQWRMVSLDLGSLLSHCALNSSCNLVISEKKKNLFSRAS